MIKPVHDKNVFLEHKYMLDNKYFSQGCVAERAYFKAETTKEMQE